jgi:hypothetical protein
LRNRRTQEKKAEKAVGKAAKESRREEPKQRKATVTSTIVATAFDFFQNQVSKLHFPHFSF